MPKFIISVTGAGGVKVAETEIEAPGRQQALLEGTEAILLQPAFPPEAVQVYREGISRGFSRDEVCDILLERWNLQFWCPEPKDESSAATNPSVSSAPQQGPVAIAPLPAPLPVASENRTPRRILRDELARLNKQMTTVRGQKAAIDRQYLSLKERRDECLRLLKAPAAPKPAAKRGRIARLESVNG